MYDLYGHFEGTAAYEISLTKTKVDLCQCEVSGIQYCVSSYNLFFCCCLTSTKFLNYQNKEMNNIFCIWLSLAVQLFPRSH